MNPCGRYKIYAGEVLDDLNIEVRLHDVNNKARTLTMVLTRADWGHITIGAQIDIVKCDEPAEKTTGST